VKSEAGEFAEAGRDAPAHLRSGLFRKYLTRMAAVVCAAVLAVGAFGIWTVYRGQTTSLISLQHAQAELAAAKIGQFVREIEGQLGWTTQLSWSGALTLEERHLDAVRLLRQVPAITELALIDSRGREQVRLSRTAMDVVGSDEDRSSDPAVVNALARGVHYGPVYFRRGSEPHVTLALAGGRSNAGVSVAEVNLIHIWDVISQIKVGERGLAYVVDATGRLIAHPDISRVLRNTDLSGLAQAQAARSGARSDDTPVTDLDGRSVLAAYAPIAPVGWVAFVEVPFDEALAPVYASLLPAGVILILALLVAVLTSLVLARRMVKPIRALQTSAARIGAGAFDHRIDIATGDELEALGAQFNGMAARLEESYANLERRIAERTHELALANLAKTRFLAVASHDLRQPLHALNLFVAQLRGERDDEERGRLVARVEAAVAAMNELFDALLDISKLDAGVTAPNLAGFPVAQVLKRIETTFAQATREKGIRLRVVPGRAWIRSDFVLLERILLNLVSNAVHYTSRGGVIVGCRRRGASLRIDVCDTGIGIPADQQRKVFGEFYQLAASGREHRRGLGLGLAIVDRLCTLLAHRIELASTPGKGSRFSVHVPLAAAPRRADQPVTAGAAGADAAPGKLVVVIDDDPMILEAMRGLLRRWGCRVVAAASADAAMAGIDGSRPDLIIADFHLTDGSTGVAAIEQLRAAAGASVPAFLLSGDTAPDRLREVGGTGYHLLHKPVDPMALRAMLNRFLTRA
jgi:signal transduction histidine kinase